MTSANDLVASGVLCFARYRALKARSTFPGPIPPPSVSGCRSDRTPALYSPPDAARAPQPKLAEARQA
jgi:hypothetical protein